MPKAREYSQKAFALMAFVQVCLAGFAPFHPKLTRNDKPIQRMAPKFGNFEKCVTAFYKANVLILIMYGYGGIN